MTNELKKIKKMLDKDILIEGQTRDTVKELIKYTAKLEIRLERVEKGLHNHIRPLGKHH